MTMTHDEAAAAVVADLDAWAAQEYQRGVGDGTAQQDTADQAQLASVQQALAAANATATADAATIAQLQQQLAGATVPQTAEVVDFAQGASFGLYPFAPPAGRGPDLTAWRLRPMSSTKAGLVPANVAGNTNPVRFARTPAGFAGVLSGLRLQGTPQGHLYGGLTVDHGDHAVISNVKIAGIPGGGSSEPLETFGLELFGCTSCIVDGLEVDGRDENGTPVGASGFASSSSTDVRLRNAHVHHHAYGMPTFWQTVGIDVVNLWSEANKIGVNMERCTGRIRFRGLRIDVGSAYGQMHMTLNNDQADAPDVEIRLDGWSGGHYGATSPFCLMIGDNYRGTGKGKQTTLPKVYGPDGSLLQWADAGGNGTPATNVAAAKADPSRWAVRFH